MRMINLWVCTLACLVTGVSGRAEVFDVLDFGAIGDGKTICTEAIQSAIDAAASKGNSKVTFRPGTYRSGAVFIKSGMEFHLPEGTVIENIEMTGVAYPLHFELNWYPSYSYPTLPDDVDPNSIPKHWKIMTTHVEPPERGIPEVRDIVISNIKATDAEQAIYANAYPEKLMRNITLENVFIEARKAGRISNATDWKMKNVQLEIVEGSLVQDNCANIPMPPIRRIAAEAIEPVESAKQESKDGAVRLGLEGGKDE